MPKANVPDSVDATTKAILYEGANMSQLEILLGMDYRTINQRIHGVPPAGKRGGANVWRLRDIVHLLYKPTPQQLEQMIPRMNPNALPKELSKEYWNALRARAAYMKEMGMLWPTGKVVEVVARLMKLTKQRIKQRVDSVERNMELSDKLRAMLKESDDALLREIQHAIQEEFKERADDVNDSREVYILKAFEGNDAPDLDEAPQPALPMIETDDEI